LQLRRSLGEGDAAFQQQAADLVNHGRASMHQSVAHPVQGLQIELIVGLDGHEAHVFPGDGFGDGLGIDEIVLVRLYERFDELCRD